MAKRRATNRRLQMNDQGDLFLDGERMFPVRRPASEAGSNARPVDLSLRIKTAMGRALKECPDSAAIVAARIGELTGRTITADALYAYTAASKPEHDIGIVRFVAFVRATGAYWLWDELLADDGLTVLQGEEARLAELGALLQQKQIVDAAVKAAERGLRKEPVKVQRRRAR